MGLPNVMGTDGIEYMLRHEGLPIDVRFMLQLHVLLQLRLTESGAMLSYRAIDSFYEHPRVQGLAEMMRYVGTVAASRQVVEKIVATGTPQEDRWACARGERKSA